MREGRASGWLSVSVREADLCSLDASVFPERHPGAWALLGSRYGEAFRGKTPLCGSAFLEGERGKGSLGPSGRAGASLGCFSASSVPGRQEDPNPLGGWRKDGVCSPLIVVLPAWRELPDFRLPGLPSSPDQRETACFPFSHSPVCTLSCRVCARSVGLVLSPEGESGQINSSHFLVCRKLRDVRDSLGMP